MAEAAVHHGGPDHSSGLAAAVELRGSRVREAGHDEALNNRASRIVLPCARPSSNPPQGVMGDGQGAFARARAAWKRGRGSRVERGGIARLARLI
jgi:hypothetical protein